MSLIESNIPKINVKSEFFPLVLTQNATLSVKERIDFGKNDKRTKNLADGLKFSNCRKEFKNLMKKKMQDKICGAEDSNAISKTVLGVCEEHL